MLREADRYRIGRKIRERRVQTGLSQGELGERLGVSYQQVQKYEKGANQLTVERLQKIAEILNVGIDYFLKRLPQMSEVPPPYGGLSAEERRLLRHYRTIVNPSARRAFFRLIQVVAQMAKGKSST